MMRFVVDPPVLVDTLSMPDWVSCASCWEVRINGADCNWLTGAVVKNDAKLGLAQTK